MGVLEIITIVLLVIKLTGAASLSWLVVFGPILIGYGLLLQHQGLGRYLRVVMM